MSRSAGFTVVELMITLVVAGLVLAIGLPAINNYRDSMALRQCKAQLLQDVRRARQLAVTRHSPVVMKFGKPTVTANITSYSIHVDKNGDKLFQAGEMFTVRKLPNGTKIQKASLTPINEIDFDMAGLLEPTGLGGRLILQNGSNGRKDTLMVSTAGVCYRP